jgi:hypothetical protein
LGINFHAFAAHWGDNSAWNHCLPLSLRTIAHTEAWGGLELLVLVVVLIADAAQNAMASEYKSITEGLILVTTIVFWDYFLDWLG